MAGLEWKLYGRAPTLDTFWDERLNLARHPADAAAIAAAEARLGVRLPDWLRTLYARYDGGAVRMARCASPEHPGDWLKAWWLLPRARLLGTADLFSFAQVRAREDFRDDAYAGLAADGDDSRLVVIATDDRVPGRALCLDYVASADVPTLVYVDAGSNRRLLVFADIDALLAALVDVQYWSPALQARHDDDARIRWLPEPPSLQNFWMPGEEGDAAVAAASDALIAAAEARLGVTLPALLKRLYRERNGGDTAWCWVPRVRFPSDRYVDWECVLIDGWLVSLDAIGSVADFARAFEDEDDFAAAAQLHAGLDQVVVLSSHNVDCLLCLDYRARGPHAEPEVVFFERWEGLVPEWRAPDFDTFFAELRRAGMEPG